MREHCANARRVAEWLSGATGVGAVLYPGLPSHPGHEVAARQMRDFGGMVSFRLLGGRPAVDALFSGGDTGPGRSARASAGSRA